MPHSTTPAASSTKPHPLLEKQPPTPSTPPSAGGLHRSLTVPTHSSKHSPRGSTSSGPLSPSLSSPLSSGRKRLFLTRQSANPLSSPPSSTSAVCSPPSNLAARPSVAMASERESYRSTPPLLFRSSSLPLVGTIAEGKALRLNTSVPPSSPGLASPYSPSFSRIPTSEPTRQYARSHSPSGSLAAARGSYYPHSGFPVAVSGAGRISPPSNRRSNSPSPGPQNYNHLINEIYIPGSASTSSSCPSTPTSLRSRSPSISSLETIEDSPEAEKEAVEREAEEAKERRLKGERRKSLNLEAGNAGVGWGGGGAVGLGVRGSLGAKRKRWSVCGAEKRGDLELETIWEDDRGVVDGGADEAQDADEEDEQGEMDEGEELDEEEEVDSDDEAEDDSEDDSDIASDVASDLEDVSEEDVASADEVEDVKVEDADASDSDELVRDASHVSPHIDKLAHHVETTKLVQYASHIEEVDDEDADADSCSLSASGSGSGVAL